MVSDQGQASGRREVIVELLDLDRAHGTPLSRRPAYNSPRIHPQGARVARSGHGFRFMNQGLACLKCLIWAALHEQAQVAVEKLYTRDRAWPGQLPLSQ
jgi:hypothetical protein